MAYKPDQYRLSKTNTREKLRAPGDLDFGIYVGEVIVRPKDDTHSGRIPVYIPMLGKDRDDPSGYYYAYWTSPFAGSTPSAKLGDNTAQFSQTMKSYGMWMVPPDPGNFVLVAFADGKKKFPVIVSCLFPDQLQFMVPGNPATAVPGANIVAPAAEINKRKDSPNHSFSSERPMHPNTTLPILNQGLLRDPIRGTTTASARRESPSEVFGILTPGPDKISPDTSQVDGTNRMGGHSFVMDDNLDQRHIRLRTGGGAQILMDDTNELLYVINHRGTAWAEINADGDINLYSDKTYTVRARGDINLRSDSNVNIDAMTAVNINAGDPDPRGDNNGQLNMQSSGIINHRTRDGGYHVEVADTGLYEVLATGEMRLSSAGSMHIVTSETSFMSAASSMNFKTGGTLNSQAGARHNILGSTVHLNDGGGAAEGTQAASVKSLDTYGFQEPPNAAPEFEYDEQAVRADTNPFPTNGLRPGDDLTLVTICTELTTREPWYGHIIETNNQANQNSLDGTSTIPQGVQPDTPSDTPIVAKPKNGYPGQSVGMEEIAGWTNPDTTFVPWTDGRRNPDMVHPMARAKFRDLPSHDGRNFTSKLGSAADYADMANGNMATRSAGLSNMLSGVITNTPQKTAVGSPIQAIAKKRDWENRGFTDSEENPNNANLLLGYVVGKNHVLSPQELERNCVVFGNPGSYKNARYANNIAMDPKNGMTFKGIGTVDSLTKLVQQRRFSELKAKGLRETAEGWTLTDTEDRGRRITIFNLDKTISEDTANLLLAADIENTREYLGKSLRSSPGISVAQFFSIVSFANSIGFRNWESSGVKSAMKRGDHSAVPYEMQRWAYKYGGGLDSILYARRQAEAFAYMLPDSISTEWNKSANSWGYKSRNLESVLGDFLYAL